MLVAHLHEINTELKFYNDMIIKVDRQPVVEREVNVKDIIEAIDSKPTRVVEEVIVEQGFFRKLFKNILPQS